MAVEKEVKLVMKAEMPEAAMSGHKDSFSSSAFSELLNHTEKGTTIIPPVKDDATKGRNKYS